MSSCKKTKGARREKFRARHHKGRDRTVRDFLHSSCWQFSEAFVKAASLQSQANIVTRGFALRIDTTELPVPTPNFKDTACSLQKLWKFLHQVPTLLEKQLFGMASVKSLPCSKLWAQGTGAATLWTETWTCCCTCTSRHKLWSWHQKWTSLLWGTPVPFTSSKLLLPNSRVSSSAIWTCWFENPADLWDPMTEKQKMVSGSYQETETQVNSRPPVAKLPTENPGCSMPLPRMLFLLLQKIPFSNFPKFSSSSSSSSSSASVSA